MRSRNRWRHEFQLQMDSDKRRYKKSEIRNPKQTHLWLKPLSQFNRLFYFTDT